MIETIRTIFDDAIDKSLNMEMAILSLYQGCVDDKIFNRAEIGDLDLEVKKIRNVKE